MNIFFCTLLIFFAGSFIGFLLETAFRFVVTHGKIIKPGFLFGPCLPMYGYGVCALFSLAVLFNGNGYRHFNEISAMAALLAVTVSCLTAIELVSGMFLEYSLGVKLWDYSTERFNYKGIICLKFSLLWGFLGIIYHFLIHPFAVDAIVWCFNHPEMNYVSAVLLIAFAADTVYSLKANRKQA